MPRASLNRRSIPRWLLVLAPILVGSGSSAAAAPPSCANLVLGNWRGAGTVMSRPIVMQQLWHVTVGGAFLELRMRHMATDTSMVPMFEGRGFYRAAGDSVQGTWLDSRGITFDVRGVCRYTLFSSHWSGSERGRTLYIREGEELLVIDSVFPPNGAAREFGRSRLRRED